MPFGMDKPPTKEQNKPQLSVKSVLLASEMRSKNSFGNRASSRMKSIPIIAVSIALAVICLANEENPPTPASTDLARLKIREGQYTQGILKKDTQLLSGVFAETFVDTFSSGQVVNKQQYLDAIKADSSKIGSLNVEDQKYQFYTDAAVVTAKFTVKGEDEGKPFNTTGRSTDVWVKINGDWFCVAAHSCLIKP
ncbi:MAG: hypothetical protein DMG88_19180 [Acidobacteria bacterium]|nr:MAG: hypothetical protein DMG88_19180 [Acidobacteriota bacterium]